MSELEETSRTHTAKHLQKLKAHLQSPANLHKYSDCFKESGKDTEMKLINRFAEGTYPGVPYTVPTEKDSKTSRGIIIVYFTVFVVFVAVGIVFLNREA